MTYKENLRGKKSGMSNIDFREVGSRIKRKRNELELTQDKLAEILGINRKTIIEWEKGDINGKIDFPTFIELCSVLKIDMPFLLGDVYSNRELETVCKYTGLSENAAKRLHELNNHAFFKVFPKLLSNLLCNYYQPFYHLIMNVFIYLRTRVEEKTLKSVRLTDDWETVSRVADQEEKINNSASISLMNCLHEIESMQEIAYKDEMIKEQLKNRSSEM